MENIPFVDTHQKVLADFSRMSQKAGSRSDYVQGGGGNTSCKLDNQLMAIKASGFRLDQIRPDDGYAVMDYQALRRFFFDNQATDFPDVEKSGSAQTKAATCEVSGLPQLRPSVEAGFHAVLDTFVLHSHSVYANFVACAVEGETLAAEVMATLAIPYAFVPYINPGSELTFAIVEARKAATKDGQVPSVIFMQNHGLIITASDADICLALHDQVNAACATFFKSSSALWPQIKLKAQGEFFLSDTPWLKERLAEGGWNLEFFTLQALYPDQLVFLTGQTALGETTLAEALKTVTSPQVKATLFADSGDVLYACSQSEAETIEETLCAIFFITQTIKAAGYEVNTMDEAGKEFIRNWESEQYRRSIAAKK